MAYKFFDKKTVLGVSVNEQLAEELHKPVLTKFKRRSLFEISRQYLGSRFSWDGFIVF